MNPPDKEQLRKAAEALIKYSGTSKSSHIAELDEDECPGCQNMRTGLKILCLLGDPTVFTVEPGGF
jgi:hypothetical protein